MPIAQKARRAGVLVRQLMTGDHPEEPLSELAELYPKFVFAWLEDEGLTVLLPANHRATSVGDQLWVPSVFRQSACWLIEVYEQQLVVHKCRDGDERDVTAQVQKVLGLTAVDNIMGPRTKREMRKFVMGVEHCRGVEPEPVRLSKWERLMQDD